MLYLHDLWVNWFESEVYGYGVCEFHEWKKEDNITLLDQVPLVHVTKELFDYIENDLDTLPEDLLELARGRSFTRKGQNRIRIDHVAVVVSGNGVLAFHTDGYDYPVFKSRLYPRQEQLVWEMIKHAKQEDFGFKGTVNQLTSQQKLMIGLTRKEREIKDYLIGKLRSVHYRGNMNELKYWLTELKPDSYEEIKNIHDGLSFGGLIDEYLVGWNSNYEDTYNKLISQKVAK